MRWVEKDVVNDFWEINGENILERVINAKESLVEVLQALIKSGYDLRKHEEME